MSVTTIRGQLVHYEAYGRGRPVIFIHGWLGSWRYWWPTMQAMANQYRSFAIDLWGFGDSSKHMGEYAVESYAAMLGEFVNEMGIAGPCALVGHSLGALIALNYTLAASDSVDRLAAVAMPLSLDHMNGYLAGRAPEGVVEQSKNRFADFPEVVMGLEKVDLGALKQSANQVGHRALMDDVQNVACPVLLVFGAKDPLIKYPTGELDNADEETPDRKCVLLEDCSHFPMLEQPAIFNRLLREFVDSSHPADVEPKSYWQRRTR